MNNLSDPARVVLFDIESTNLKADFGYCLCFGYKELGAKRTHVLSVTDFKHHKTDPTNDAPLMRRVHDVLTNHADIIVTYYGKGFDRKFLNTRMLMAGLPPLPPLGYEHVDLYYTAKSNLALHSNRLASVAAALGCPMEKTALDGPTWTRAMAGDPRSIRYIIDHCRRDVDVLEYCYQKLRPYIRQHPHVGPRTACRVCGSHEAQSRGYTIVKVGGRQMRKMCKSCGAWRTEKIG
jgi:uncharacterized protein YprB with RNaseH-like and TPR domain